MKIFLENDKVKLIHSGISTANMMGSAIHEVKKYVLDRFPKNFFKEVRIDTATISGMTNLNKEYNRDLNKIIYPSITISPEFTLDNALNGSTLNITRSSPHLHLMQNMKNYYYEIMTDYDNMMKMYYTCSPITMYFNFKIAVKTYIQNINILKWINDTLLPNRMLFLNRCRISTEIPKTFIAVIAKLLNADMNRPEDLKRIETYLIQLCRREGNIYKKLNTTTGRYGFFMDDPTDILITLEDLNGPGSVMRDSQAEGEYLINFRIQCNLDISNNYIMIVDKTKFKKIADDKKLSDSLFEESNMDNNLYTMSLIDPIKVKSRESIRFKDKDDNHHIGTLVHSEILTFGSENESTVINVDQMLNTHFLRTHAYAISENIDPSSFIYFDIVRRDKGIDTVIDYDLLSIDLKEINSDVAISIYIDREIYEHLEKSRTSKKSPFRDEFIGTVKFTCGNESYNVLVKGFENINEMYSTDIMKSLRCETIYGTGYLYLVDEDHENASDLKIVVGMDGETPIIKSLVLVREDKKKKNVV